MVKIDLFDTVPGDLIYWGLPRHVLNVLLVISNTDHKLLVLYLDRHMTRLRQYPTVCQDGTHVVWYCEFILANRMTTGDD